MNPLDPLSNAWVDDRLEAFLDGDLSPEEAERLADLVAAADAWADALGLAGEIQQALQALPEPACPPVLTQRVLRQTRQQARAEWLDGWLQRLMAGLQQRLQPALAMAVLLALVVTAALVVTPRPAPPPSEVELALADVKRTLSYLSEVGRRTGTSVRQDVLEMRVVMPVQHALGNARAEHAN